MYHGFINVSYPHTGFEGFSDQEIVIPHKFKENPLIIKEHGTQGPSSGI
jgi:hypothetical protein